MCVIQILLGIVTICCCSPYYFFLILKIKKRSFNLTIHLIERKHHLLNVFPTRSDFVEKQSRYGHKAQKYIGPFFLDNSMLVNHFCLRPKVLLSCLKSLTYINQKLTAEKEQDGYLIQFRYRPNFCSLQPRSTDWLKVAYQPSIQADRPNVQQK